MAFARETKMPQRWAMTICPLEGYIQGGGLSQEGASLLSQANICAVFHLLLIPQQTLLITYQGPANPEKVTMSNGISVTFRKWRASHGSGSAASHFIWYLRSFLGRLASPLIRSWALLTSLSPPDWWLATPGLFLGPGFHQGALEGSECEKHPFPEGLPRPPFSTPNKHLMKRCGATAVWEATPVAVLPFLMF